MPTVRCAPGSWLRPAFESTADPAYLCHVHALGLRDLGHRRRPLLAQQALPVVRQPERPHQRGAKARPDPGSPLHLPCGVSYDRLRASLRSEAPTDHGGRGRALPGARSANSARRHAALLPGAGHRARGTARGHCGLHVQLGAGRLQTSTLRRRINQRDWTAAGQELRRWVYGGRKVMPGLVARRESESILLLK